MTPCASCGLHARSEASACPHCGHRRPSTATRTAAAVLLGLTLATGCGGDEGTKDDQHSAPQSLYGAPTTTDDTGPQ
jgi:hypothetical protein